MWPAMEGGRGLVGRGEERRGREEGEERTEEDFADAAEGAFEVVGRFVAEVEVRVPFVQCVWGNGLG